MGAGFLRPLCTWASSPNRGQAECNECGVHTFAPSRGSIECRDCDIGTESHNGSAFCVTCLPDTRGRQNRTLCRCNPGMYRNADMASQECQRCLPGFHQPLSGQDLCLPCARGKRAIPMSSPRAPTAILASLHQIPVRLSVFVHNRNRVSL